jgi:hypothetical protein
MPEGESTEATAPVEQRDAADTETPDKLKSALESERKLKREAERELKELRRFKQEREQAEQTEAERLQARIKDLDAKEQQLTTRERTMAVRDGLAAAAAAENLTLIVSPATALRLLDLNDVEFDDDGEATNLGQLLKQLAKDEPKLFDQRRRPGSADAGATSISDSRTVQPGLDRMRAAYAASSTRRR